jgi:hypothetical protein
MGFIPTSGLDRESHQCVANEENLCTSFGLALLLFFNVLLMLSLLFSVEVEGEVAVEAD